MNTLKKLSLVTAGIALVSVVTTKPVQAFVISFETLDEFEKIDDQFLELGIDFNGSASIVEAEASLRPSFPPTSGTKVIYDNPALSDGTIRIDAVGSWLSRVGGFVTGNKNITLIAFDIDGSILDTDSTGRANYVGANTGLQPNIFLEVTAPNIAFVTFQGTGNSFTVDDFTAIPVPEPSSVIGLGVALFGFGAWMKRHHSHRKIKHTA